jgi:hypothetical protein
MLKLKKHTMKKPKISLTTRTGKYFVAIQKGKSKKEAQAVAGYAPSGNIAAIENSEEFKALEKHFNTAFLAKMSMDEVADHLIDNIKQEGQERVDRAARNGAIKIALDKLEPDGGGRQEPDRVMIVLSKPK